ncbi:HAMP domain-containing histidine kinase [Magnetococcus marinus]|nr:HAMP domain-containing histidine kinase [Magnetococcus marinus]
MALASLLFLFQYLYQQQLTQGAHSMAAQVQLLFKASLENAMLKRDLEGLDDIVQKLAQQPGIQNVMILNPVGEVRFSSNSSDLYQILDPEAMPDQVKQPSNRFMQDRQQQAVLRSYFPVPNQAPCQVCHGSLEHSPINGIVAVDFAAQAVEHEARHKTMLLFYVALLILLLSMLFAWLAARRVILQPLAALSQLAQTFAMGDLQARSTLAGQDELHQLGRTLNQMADNLQITLRRLAEQEAYTHSILDQLPDGVRVIDGQMRTLLTNRIFRERLGLEEDAAEMAPCFAVSHARTTPCPPTLVTCPVYEILDKPGQRLKSLQTHLHTDGQQELQVEVVASAVEILKEGKPVKVIVESVRDIKEAMAFAHGQKLAVLGQLASGIAHEVRNPLANIRFAIQSNLRGASITTEQLEETVALTEQAVDHCIEITERILKLSEAPGELSLLELNSLSQECVALMAWNAREHSVNMQIELSNQQPRTLAADSDLRIILLNLMQNALHAMPHGGSLRVGTSRGNGRVAFVVEDSGVGMDPLIQSHMFDPFFSRRADGSRGAGLGLTLVHSLVSRYNGQIMLDSTPGKGSRFTITLTDADTPLPLGEEV